MEEHSSPATDVDFSALLASLSDVIYQVQVHPFSRTDYVSPSIGPLTGYSPEKLREDPDAWLSLLHPDDAPALLAVLTDPSTAPTRIRVRWVALDGSIIWMEHVLVRFDEPDNSVIFKGVGRPLTSPISSEVEDSARHRELLGSPSELVVVTSLGGVISWVSPSVADFTGFSASQMVGRSALEFLHPDDVHEASESTRTRAPDAVVVGRSRLLQKDGSTEPFTYTSKPLFTEDGSVEGRVVSWFLLDDQMRTVLDHSESRYRLLAENASDWVFRGNMEAVVEWTSPSVTEVLGWHPSEVMGRSTLGLVHPMDAFHVKEATKSIKDGKKYTYEARFLRKDGSYRWLAVTVRPATDSSGVVVGRVGSARDVHNEVVSRHKLATSERLFRLAMESAPTGMALVSLDGVFERVNPALGNILNADPDWLLGLRVTDVMEPEDLDVYTRMCSSVLTKSLSSIARELRLRRQDGSLVWVEYSIGVLRNDDGEPLSFVTQCVNITDAKESRETLEFLATHDTLTRLVNRQGLLDSVQTFLDRTPSGEAAALGLLFLDMDGLKRVNDTYGHGVGDQVLTAVAERIVSQVRSEDVVARLGGDEFVVALPGVKSVKAAERVASYLHRAMNTPILVGEHSLTPTVSLGVSMASVGVSAKELLHQADLALYRAKRDGRSCTVVFDPLVDLNPELSALRGN